MGEPTGATQTGAAYLSSTSSLRAAIEAFQTYMHQRDFSPHTVQAFNSDLRMLEQFVGPGRAVGRISTHDLNAFLKWDKLGKTEQETPRLRGLLAAYKRMLGRTRGDEPSDRTLITMAITD